jgi:hypothetical protein
MQSRELVGVLPAARVQGTLPADHRSRHDSRQATPRCLFVCLEASPPTVTASPRAVAASAAAVVVGSCPTA